MKETDIAARLAEIKARESQASKGPWTHDSYNAVIDAHGRSMLEIADHPADGEFGNDDEGIKLRSAWYAESASNAVFAAAAREDIPWLIEQLEVEQSKREYTQKWYAGRYGKLQDWARKRLPDPWINEFFGCIANGLWHHSKDLAAPYFAKGGFWVTPGNYFRTDTAQGQLILDQTARAEDAEVERDRLAEENERLRHTLNRLANEASGFLSMADRNVHGFTNAAILRDRIQEAREALSGDRRPE